MRERPPPRRDPQPTPDPPTTRRELLPTGDLPPPRRPRRPRPATPRPTARRRRRDRPPEERPREDPPRSAPPRAEAGRRAPRRGARRAISALLRDADAEDEEPFRRQEALQADRQGQGPRPARVLEPHPREEVAQAQAAPLQPGRHKRPRRPARQEAAGGR